MGDQCLSFKKKRSEDYIKKWSVNIKCVLFRELKQLRILFTDATSEKLYENVQNIEETSLTASTNLHGETFYDTHIFTF